MRKDRLPRRIAVGVVAVALAVGGTAVGLKSSGSEGCGPSGGGNLASITVACPTPTFSPPPTSGANLWIATSGGSSSCSNSSSLIDYATALATGHVCDTFNRAYQAASVSGSLVVVKCGSYGPQTIASKGSQLAMVTFQSETGTCATVQGTTASAAVSFFGGAAKWVTIDHFTIKTCPLGCTSPNRAVLDNNGAGAQTNHITITNNQINVGTVNEGGDLIHGYHGQNWTIMGNTFGPTCCAAGTNISPVGVTFGKPASGANDCAHMACNLKIDNNVFQYANLRRSTDWPTSGWGAAPEATCSNFATCHTDGIHVFGCIGCEFNYNQFLGSVCEGIYLESGGGQGNDNRDITIIGNAGTVFADHCNGLIYFKCNGAGAGCGGTNNIGFNESPDLITLGAGAGTPFSGAEPGTVFNIYGNYATLFVAVNGNNAGCSAGTNGNVTVNYSYNIWRTGTGGATSGPCGASDSTGNTTAWINSAGAPNVGLDMHKTGAGGVADNFVSCSLVIVGCPPADYDGDALAATADAGADQR